MRTDYILRTIIWTGIALTPLPGSAQEAGPPVAAASAADDVKAAQPNAVELGGAYQDTDSFRFGKYTGLTDKGALGVSTVIIRGRDDWESGSTRNWDVSGTNLGLTSRAIGARYGHQGAWNASFLYDQLPFYQSDTAVNLFGDVGSASLTLPTGLPTNTNPARGLALFPFLHPLDVSVERKITGAGVNVEAHSNWKLSFNASHEHKDGLKEQSLSVNDRTDPVFFAEPLSYDTSTAEATAQYGRRNVHLQFGYVYSGFTNANSAVVVPSPYLGAANQPVGVPLQYTLPPSNSAHDTSFAFSYKVTPGTHLNVNLGYGLQLQDQTILPYTLNSSIKTSPLPRTSVDGKLQTYLAQFRATAHPASRLDVSGSYTYDKRKNDTPRDPYNMVQEPDWATMVQWSVPYGFTDQTGRLNASYRVVKGSKVEVNYTYQKKERTYSEVTDQTENSVRGRFSQEFPVGTAYVSYQYGVREAANYQPYAYDFALGNLPSTTPILPYPNNAVINGYPLEPNYYLFKRFFLADRNRKEAKAGANLNLSENLSLELFGRRVSDDYTHSSYGMTDARWWSTDADMAYVIEGVVDLHGFYTYESNVNNQQSLASTGIVNNTPTSQWTWTNNYHDHVHTVGLGTSWNVIGKTLKVGYRYQLSLGNTDVNVVSGPGAGTSAQFVSKPVPTIETSSYGSKIFGDYLVRSNVTLRVVYDYEHLNTDDPALNTGPMPNTAQTSLTGVVGTPSYGWLLSGDTSGEYRLQLVTASLIWRF